MNRERLLHGDPGPGRGDYFDSELDLLLTGSAGRAVLVADVLRLKAEMSQLRQRPRPGNLFAPWIDLPLRALRARRDEVLDRPAA